MATMVSMRLLQLPAACFSSSSLISLASPCPSRSVVRATTVDKRWTGTFNPLSNYSVNGSRTFQLSQVNGQGPQRNLQVAAIFGKKKPPVAVKPTVIPDPDYRIPIVLLGAAGALVYSDNLVAAIPVGILGLIFLQGTRLKVVFDNEALEIKIGEDLKDSGQNVFVGGKSRWKYSSFTNWEIFWPNFPVLAYFTETQTKPEGQFHFFPLTCNAKQVYDVMVERCGPSKNSGPK